MQIGSRSISQNLFLLLSLDRFITRIDFNFVIGTGRSMAMETPHVHCWWGDEKLLYDTSAIQSDVNDDPAISMTNTEKEKLLTNDINQGVKLVFAEDILSVTEQNYMEKIRELHQRLDMVKKTVRPGCSYEVLNTALSCLSSLATVLSRMPPKLHASL